MTTIYRTDYEFYGSTYVLCFSLSENIKHQIADWEEALDKMIFDEQMATGSFRGRWAIDDKQRYLMELLLEKGIVQPYYGAMNARACTYTLRVSPPTCIILVNHIVAEEKTSFEDTISILQAEASEIAQSHKHGFMITEKEYQTLKNWGLWNSEDEFTSRYVYTFEPTTLGLITKVTDTRTGEQIDISDYSNW